MKKILSVLLVLSMLLAASAALADDTGIQVIGSPEAEDDVVILDDLKQGQIATIEGFGNVQIYSAEWIDGFGSRNKDNYISNYYYESGEEAQFLRLNIRILNTTFAAKNYHSMFSDIICDYGDGYQFKGWYRQRHNDTDEGMAYDDSKLSYDISPLYAGRYIVCVTLPNICVDSDEPISVTFKIGDNEFTYHHRK